MPPTDIARSLMSLIAAIILFLGILPATAIAIWTSYSYAVAIGGLVLFFIGASLVRYEGRDTGGNSGLLGLAMIVCGAPLIVTISNLIAGLIRTLVLFLQG